MQRRRAIEALEARAPPPDSMATVFNSMYVPTINFVTRSVFFSTPRKAFNVFIGTSAVDLITYIMLRAVLCAWSLR